MCVVSGKKGKDAFTCVSGRFCSVVDFYVVGVEDFDMIENFRTTTMCEAVEEMRSDGVSMTVPDHSLLYWDTVLERSTVWRGSEEIQAENPVRVARYVVPENYLEAKVEDIKELEAGVMNTGNNQNMLDEVYECAVRMVKSSWEAEAQDHSKLDVLQRLLANGCKLKCVDVERKRVQRIVAKWRGGTAELRVETE